MSRPRQDQDQSQKSRNLVLCITMPTALTYASAHAHAPLQSPALESPYTNQTSTSYHRPQIKKNFLQMFLTTFFAIFWNFLSLLYDDSHSTKHDRKVIEKNFDNKKDAHILSKYNKKKIVEIHNYNWSTEIFHFM